MRRRDPAVGTFVVPRVLGKFGKSYPNVDITLEVVNRGYLVEAMEQNKLDMVIMGKIPTEMPVFVHPLHLMS